MCYLLIVFILISFILTLISKLMTFLFLKLTCSSIMKNVCTSYYNSSYNNYHWASILVFVFCLCHTSGYSLPNYGALYQHYIFIIISMTVYIMTVCAFMLTVHQILLLWHNIIFSGKSTCCEISLLWLSTNLSAVHTNKPHGYCTSVPHTWIRAFIAPLLSALFTFSPSTSTLPLGYLISYKLLLHHVCLIISNSKYWSLFVV